MLLSDATQRTPYIHVARFDQGPCMHLLIAGPQRSKRVHR